MPSNIFSILFILPLLLFLPSSFAAAPLELKVQIVGWRQVPFYNKLLENLEPGKRLLVTLSKMKGQTGISRTTKAAGHYEIATFQLPGVWEREMMSNPAVNPTSEFVRNNDFQLEVALSPDAKNDKYNNRLFYTYFQLTSRHRNFVRIALRVRGPMDTTVLSASQLELPVGNLLFKVQDNMHGQESTSSTTATAAEEAPPPFMLTRIECPTGGWSIGDNSPENKVLLAKKQRVCEDDHYLVHYEPVDGDLLGNLLWIPGTPRDLFCPEAMFELDWINAYTIGMEKDGQLTCQLDTPPLARRIVQYILLSQPHNIAAIWPHIVKMHLEKDYRRFEKLLKTPNPLTAGPIRRNRAQQVDIEGQRSGAEQEQQQLNPNKRHNVGQSSGVEQEQQLIPEKRQKNIHNLPLGQQQHPFVASRTADSQQMQQQMQLELQQRQQVQHAQQRAQQQRVRQNPEMQQQQPEVENQLQQQVQHAQLQQQVQHAQLQQQRVERRPALHQLHYNQPPHMPRLNVDKTVWQNEQAQQHSLDGEETVSSAQQVAEQQPRQHQQQHPHQHQEEAQQLPQPANANNEEWSPSFFAELDELLND